MKSAMKQLPDTEAKTDKKNIVWRIYYGDKSTFDSSMGTPAEAPSTGVICIVQKDRQHGFVVTAFKDFYWRENGEWWGSDQAGFWQHMFTPGSKVVKFGQSVPGELFNEIMSQATKDQQFGVKSSNSLLEYGSEQGWSDAREVPTN